ncbi:barstar family protein [Pendulispora rubella]|uniref:barstar family protein n=1 Tax=Pendulispora rubella TaxID=2741070 RepID=UPI00374E08CE
MTIEDPFIYVSNDLRTQAESAHSERLVAHVPPGIVDVQVLFNALVEQVGFPGYFGFNWNALSDCLRDLHWLRERELVLIHRDVPGLPPSEIHQYVTVLAECVLDWRPGEPHELKVIFPDSGKEVIGQILRRI